MYKIGASEIPQITVWNKVDKEKEQTFRNKDDNYISALKGTGLAELLNKIEEKIKVCFEYKTLFIPYEKHSLMENIFKSGIVTDKKETDEGTSVTVYLPSKLASDLRNFTVLT